MLYLYDKALKEKFESVMPGKVIYAPVDKFYERYLLSNDNHKLELPALSIWRSSFTIDKSTIPSHLRIGNTRYPNNQNFTAEQFFSVRVEMSFQLDIWTSTDIDRDVLLQEILYFLTLYPYVSISYRDKKFTFPITIGDVSDSTDISSFENTGDIYRLTLPIQIPDARLFYFEEVKTMKYIDLKLYCDDTEEKF